MVCQLTSNKCEGMTRAGTRCKHCVGRSGVGLRKNAPCVACWQHKKQFCQSKGTKQYIAQVRMKKQLANSSGGWGPKAAQSLPKSFKPNPTWQKGYALAQMKKKVP